MPVDVCKDIKTLTDFIVSGAKGQYLTRTPEEMEDIDKRGSELIAKTSLDLAIAKLSDIANMNIFEMNIHFFDNYPRLWAACQNAAEISVRRA